MNATFLKAVRVLKYTAGALGVALAGLAVFMLLNLTDTVDDQSKTIVGLQETIDTLREDDGRRTAVLDYLQDDAASDECRDAVEQRFLAAIGRVVLGAAGDTEPTPQAVDVFERAVDEISAIDRACPHPTGP